MSHSHHVTPRQQEVLVYVSRFRRRNAMGPTLQEIADHFGISKVTVHEHVRVLTEKGMLGGRRDLARSAWVTRRGSSCLPPESLELLRDAWEACSEEERLEFMAERNLAPKRARRRRARA